VHYLKNEKAPKLTIISQSYSLTTRLYAMYNSLMRPLRWSYEGIPVSCPNWVFCWKYERDHTFGPIIVDSALLEYDEATRLTNNTRELMSPIRAFQ